MAIPLTVHDGGICVTRACYLPNIKRVSPALLFPDMLTCNFFAPL
jgi:hypothetical protein